MTDPLLLRLRDQDPTGVRDAMAAHGQAIYGFLLRLTGHRPTAEDLFQETWLAFARHGPNLAPETPLRTWLFTVAHNAYRSHRRWERVDPSRWLIVEPTSHRELDAGVTPEREVGARREVERVAAAMAKLAPRDREVLVLAAAEEDGIRGSTALGIPPDTFRQRLSRARKALVSALGPARGMKSSVSALGSASASVPPARDRGPLHCDPLPTASLNEEKKA
jgi:RNA polymerase sigma-70 factor (ECF subfamily)